jgi:hypothetical protein
MYTRLATVADASPSAIARRNTTGMEQCERGQQSGRWTKTETPDTEWCRLPSIAASGPRAHS